MRYIFLLLFFLSSNIKAIEIQLDPKFLEREKIKLNYVESPTGGHDLRGELVSPSGKITVLPDDCPSEGGDPQLGEVYTLNLPHELLIINCIYQINHSGLGIKGKDYKALVFENKDKKIYQRKDIEKLISGYEGSSEDGDYYYFYYNDKTLATLKIIESSANSNEDSLILAHKVILMRLKNHDYGAIENYASVNRVKNLISTHPITLETSGAYNDIGYSLSEIGKEKEALDLFYAIEKISPERTVLMLNIADSLWRKNERKQAKEYYLKYKKNMDKTGRSKRIPSRVEERIK
ncbi:tetratricopeptide repeat protein [Pseudomonas sp. BMS12]|uniref:tetratricopeptide repeat protein n=1 Tax=Pseudomonas sp. BMS12 TaxID=1796033 RepID=UPI000A7A33DF|nr:hypothetical protein [Pseudomonas sp. BMS12]